MIYPSYRVRVSLMNKSRQVGFIIPIADPPARTEHTEQRKWRATAVQRKSCLLLAVMAFRFPGENKHLRAEPPHFARSKSSQLSDRHKMHFPSAQENSKAASGRKLLRLSPLQSFVMLPGHATLMLLSHQNESRWGHLPSGNSCQESRYFTAGWR